MGINIFEQLDTDIGADFAAASHDFSKAWADEYGVPDTSAAGLGRFSPLHDQNNSDAERQAVREELHQSEQLQATKTEIVSKQQAYTQVVAHFATGTGVDLVSPERATFRKRGMAS